MSETRVIAELRRRIAAYGDAREEQGREQDDRDAFHRITVEVDRTDEAVASALVRLDEILQAVVEAVRGVVLDEDGR